jgi:hypothetical protein
VSLLANRATWNRPRAVMARLGEAALPGWRIAGVSLRRAEKAQASAGALIYWTSGRLYIRSLPDVRSIAALRCGLVAGRADQRWAGYVSGIVRNDAAAIGAVRAPHLERTYATEVPGR